MTMFEGSGTMLKRAVVFSLGFHVILFVLIAVSPTLPKPAQKGMIHYVRFGSPPGGGGGGGGQKPSAAVPAQKETLKDLTLSSKVKPEAKPSMAYPVNKPKKDRKSGEEKKAAITKPSSSLRDAPANAEQGVGSGKGSGSGLRIGLGEGPGSGGFGSGYGDQVGLSDFPYQYYLQIITDRVSASWFTSLVDPGVSGSFFATVYFKILRNGQVSDLKVVESSGIPSLDLSAQRAIQTTAPFPPLPSEYEGTYLGIHLIFEHSK